MKYCVYEMPICSNMKCQFVSHMYHCSHSYIPCCGWGKDQWATLCHNSQAL